MVPQPRHTYQTPKSHSNEIDHVGRDGSSARKHHLNSSSEGILHPAEDQRVPNAVLSYDAPEIQSPTCYAQMNTHVALVTRVGN